MAPIRIQAEALRGPLAAGGAAGAFALSPDDLADRPCTGTGEWREADVARAITVAQQAGLTAYRVEIAPDGTIAIVVCSPAQASDET